MLDIKFIRENRKEVKEAINNKRVNLDLDKLLDLDDKYKKLLSEVENLRAERNKISKMGKNGVELGKRVKEDLKKIEPKLDKVNHELFELMALVPNIPSEDTPVGKDESENKVIRKWGTPPKFDFKPKDHLELGENLDIINIEIAGKISGSRFAYLKGGAALLEFALVQFAFCVLTDEKILQTIVDKIKKGYSYKPFIPVVPPVFIREDVYEKMARLNPKDERYYIPSDNLYLIGSAEHTLGPMHMDNVIEDKEIPLRYVGFSTSFRREAGSYGKDTKGILRVHQFDKVEIESFTSPDMGINEQNFFVAIQEYLMQKLEIPYQVVAICTGDMGAPDHRQVDLESWLPGENKYRETHTSDYMTDYQARRLNTKIQKNGTTNFAHMNDATVFAIGRTIVAILENYQQKDGSVLIPKVLQKYTVFDKIKSKK